jgi:glycine dehydrogenase subunit 2
MVDLEEMLAEIVGLDAVSLQPSAGAHGELTGMLMIRT